MNSQEMQLFRDVQRNMIRKVPALASKLEAVYDRLGWTWGLESGYTPTVRQIEDGLYDRILSLKETTRFSLCGGLYASWWRDAPGAIEGEVGMQISESVSSISEGG